MVDKKRKLFVKQSGEEMEEEPLEQEEDSTLTMEAPIVPIKETNSISLKSTPNEILDKITNAETVDDLKELTKLFHLSLAKKEATRVLTQSELLDVVLEQAGDRIRKRPGELSLKDLLDYMNAFQASIDKSSKSLETKIEETPPLTLNQTKQEINININNGQSVSISEESRARILEVINALTKNKTISDTSKEVKIISKEEETSKGEQ